jgi:hypothetical protein
MPLQILLYVTTFAISVGIFQVLISEAVAGRAGRRRINRRLDLLQAGLTPDKVYSSLVRNPAGLNFGHQGLDAYYQKLAHALLQAGLRISPQRLLVIVGLTVLALWMTSLLGLRAHPHFCSRPAAPGASSPGGGASASGGSKSSCLWRSTWSIARCAPAIR